LNVGLYLRIIIQDRAQVADNRPGVRIMRMAVYFIVDPKTLFGTRDKAGIL
jgi:hypothetical protein